MTIIHISSTHHLFFTLDDGTEVKKKRSMKERIAEKEAKRKAELEERKKQVITNNSTQFTILY